MELLIVIIVIAVLATIALPKFVNSGARGKESTLKADLKLYREAIERFRNDTSVFPKTLDSLTATSAPSEGITATDDKAPLSAGWNGPYLQKAPKDPVSGSSFTYTTTGTTIGEIHSSATGNDTNGVPFANY